MAKGELIFEAKNLVKHFGPTVALNGVDFKVYRGQITGLIGENGSGKSTITSIAAGMQPATSGEMFFKGKPHNPSTMIEGAELGIGMIVQEQGTVSGITVAQNIFLGEEERFKSGPFVSKRKMNKEAKKALDRIGFENVDPSVYIDRLNMQDRKLVEIAKTMYNNPEMLVVDETTTALSQQGRDIIYDIMKRMRDDNKAVVFISHDLEELMEVCDTLTVLRDGNIITTFDKDEYEENAIKAAMIGREMDGEYYRSDYGTPVSKEVVLKADNITTGSGMLMNFSMELHKGEILGVGGLSHCGMHELGRALFGEEKLLEGKVIDMATGDEITSARCALKHGYGYVSKNRDTEALVLTESIADNILAAGYDKIEKGIYLSPKKTKEYVNKQKEALSIKCASVKQEVQALSGGNKQKVVFGKWVGRDCDILILDCPTRGVDIGVKAAMYQLINDMRKRGKSIVMISEELPELIGMSDRLLILKDGQQTGELERRPDLDGNDVIDMMI
ncbi:MAG: sugar ABC transporter ATP-binding protein [Lachnospiraceae bacterium]|nr:sugar ABC transporter ATP-binding protein [Lachnospiraceae bacterium]